MDRQEPHNSGLQLAGGIYIQFQLFPALRYVAVRKDHPRVGWLGRTRRHVLCSVIWRKQRSLALKEACPLHWYPI